MNIVLINPPGLKAMKSLGLHSPNPPVGLVYLAAVLRKNGHAYQVIDMAGEGLDQAAPLPGKPGVYVQGLTIEQALKRIPSDTSVIGISCMFSIQWPIVVDLLRRLRTDFPGVKLVAGGEHVTALPEHSLATTDLDIAVLGEGESVLPPLLETLRTGGDLSSVPGIAYKKEDGTVARNPRVPFIRNLDELPWPDWQAIPIERYMEQDLQNGVNRGRSMPIVATRGCPFRCAFCSNRMMWGGIYRMRSPENVVAEMKSYVEQYRATNFNFQDLTAFVDKKWVLRLADEIMGQGLRITWQLPSGTRIEGFDGTVARAVRQAGCRNLAFAPESASPEVLRSVGKVMDFKALDSAIDAAISNDINLSCFFVVGLPEETHETLRKTLAFVRSLARRGVSDIGVTQFVPYPGSELFERLTANGTIVLDNDFFFSPLEFYLRTDRSYAAALSPRELYRWQIRLLVNFYLLSAVTHPFRMTKNVLKAIFLKREETRYSKFITDIIYRRPLMRLRSLLTRRKGAAGPR